MAGVVEGRQAWSLEVSDPVDEAGSGSFPASDPPAWPAAPTRGFVDTTDNRVSAWREGESFERWERMLARAAEMAAAGAPYEAVPRVRQVLREVEAELRHVRDPAVLEALRARAQLALQRYRDAWDAFEAEVCGRQRRFLARELAEYRRPGVTSRRPRGGGETKPQRPARPPL